MRYVNYVCPSCGFGWGWDCSSPRNCPCPNCEEKDVQPLSEIVVGCWLKSGKRVPMWLELPYGIWQSLTEPWKLLMFLIVSFVYLTPLLLGALAFYLELESHIAKVLAVGWMLSIVIAIVVLFKGSLAFDLLNKKLKKDKETRSLKL